jgi:hypothetical protein
VIAEAPDAARANALCDACKRAAGI